jgi:hypothetical protein
MRARARLVIATFSVVLAAACAHSPEPVPASQGTTTGASFTLANRAAEEGAAGGELAGSPDLSEPGHPANRVGTAACERKLECDQIGDGKPHASEQACLTTARRHAHEELDRLSCDNGLDDARLTDCIQAVRIAECENVDSITRVGACARAQLCAR